MNADGGLISVHPCSSAVCESCFPGKKSRKTFGQVLKQIPEGLWPGTYSFTENIPVGIGISGVFGSNLPIRTG